MMLLLDNFEHLLASPGTVIPSNHGAGAPRIR